MKPGESVTPGAKNSSSSGKPADPQQAPPPNKSGNEKDQAGSWQYQAEEAPDDQPPPTASYVQPVSWTASEYVSHHKNAGWFILVMLVIVGVAGIVYLWTNDIVSPVVIVIIGLAFTVFAGRPPETLEYSLDGTGIHIGQKTYLYERFRSFSVLADEPIPTIMLIPMRRFDLPLTIHFDPGDADQIIQLLGSYLPGEERNAPPVDRLMSKIRF